MTVNDKKKKEKTQTNKVLIYGLTTDELKLVFSLAVITTNFLDFNCFIFYNLHYCLTSIILLVSYIKFDFFLMAHQPRWII